MNDKQTNEKKEIHKKPVAADKKNKENLSAALKANLTRRKNTVNSNG